MGDFKVLQICRLDQRRDVRLKQINAIGIASMTLPWAFTSYQRCSKLGSVTILTSLPLFVAIHFLLGARLIALGYFSLYYAPWIFLFLTVHFILVLLLKLCFEERAAPRNQRVSCGAVTFMRPNLYVLLSTVASTLVYLKVKPPSSISEDLSLSHGTLLVQSLYLLLVFLENCFLYFFGLVRAGLNVGGLNIALFLGYFLCGVILQAAYYRSLRGCRCCCRPHTCCSSDQYSQLPTTGA